MDFYSSIADFYREIFPLKPVQVQFILSAFRTPEKNTLLDVGCGAGDLAGALAPHFEKVHGIDLDQAMLDQARTPLPGNLHLEAMNMLDLVNRFGRNAFDGLCCLGNTLVHLDRQESVYQFLEQARNALRPEGKLFIQIIHYDRILDQGIHSLPTIETNRYRFERNYHYRDAVHRIDFETIATHKETGASLRNMIPLLPLRKDEMQVMLDQLGFDQIRYYGNFQKAPLLPDSIPLILQAGL